MDAMEYLTVLAAIKKLARQNKFYSKRAFEEWLDKARKSDKADELIPEELRAPIAPHVIKAVLEGFFCKAVELRHCKPVPKEQVCQCNKVMMFWQDQIEIQCDRVAVDKIKVKSKLECDMKLEDVSCSFDHLIPCDQRPVTTDFVMLDKFDNEIQQYQQQADEAEEQQRTAESKLEETKAKLIRVGKILSGKPIPVRVAGSIKVRDGDSDSDDGDL